MIKTLIIFGTRPEAIKLAPVIKVLNSDKRFKTFVCSTGQHREMLQQVLDIFKIKLDYDLELMKKNQDLFDISSRSLLKLKNIIRAIKPSILIVQGDTSTAFISALAAFYSKVRIAHVEAGLRSYNIHSPYPEEANRRFISIISNIHFAPTKESRDNLIREGISKNTIFVTGNTVIDALFEVKKQINAPLKSKKIYEHLAEYLPSDFFAKKFVLITMHRREKFGKELEVVLRTLKKLACNHKELNFVYPVHLNPNVQAPVQKLLGNQPNVYLIPPQDYINFIYLMSKCYFLLSDSGGVQEECYVFKKPIIVLRDVTERNEALHAGYAFLSGSDPIKIEKYFSMIYNRLNKNYNFFRGKNPFGDGHAAFKILKILSE
jgi:UDP-N-acetylglucosamine 2-epimerase (non-hydrolysing)